MLTCSSCRSDQVRLQSTQLIRFLGSFSNLRSSGFAAEAPINALQTLSTQDAKYKPDIEEDKVVNANGDYAAAL